jgi:fructose-bisphosphate aldolase / 6-deoxy-5-ketofructose 1-phosphate synthase
MKNKTPLSVPKNKEADYLRNLKQATYNTGNLFLFAGDQKIEHLNDDFSDEFKNANPEHLFEIASKSKVGVFAAHLGLISRYGRKYKNIPYLVKLDGKSNIVKSKDPLSRGLWSVSDVLEFRKSSKLKILGLGYTIYLGSEYEDEMLREAAQIVLEAHKNGLIVVLWIYPRGKNVKNEKSLDTIAGAAGLALCLGADFVKLNYPLGVEKKEVEKFKKVVIAAGNTGVICSGGSKIDGKKLLKLSEKQIKVAGTKGFAIGRNIHQNSLKSAIKLSNDLHDIIKKKKQY